MLRFVTCYIFDKFSEQSIQVIVSSDNAFRRRVPRPLADSVSGPIPTDTNDTIFIDPPSHYFLLLAIEKLDWPSPTRSTRLDSRTIGEAMLEIRERRKKGKEYPFIHDREVDSFSKKGNSRESISPSPILRIPVVSLLASSPTHQLLPADNS